MSLTNLLLACLLGVEVLKLLVLTCSHRQLKKGVRSL